jgi:hypothetical protein
MRILISTIFIFLYSLAYSQKGKVIYETKIESASKVNINSGEINISKADTVIINSKFIVSLDPQRPKVYLANVTGEKDSTGTYTTYYTFAPKGNLLSFDFDLLITFDKPFIDPVLNFMASGGVYTFSWQDYSVENKYIRLIGKAQNKSLTIFLRSKEPLNAKIFGTDGVL